MTEFIDKEMKDILDRLAESFKESVKESEAKTFEEACQYAGRHVLINEIKDEQTL